MSDEVSRVIADLISGREVSGVSDEVMAEVRARLGAAVAFPPRVMYEVIRGTGIWGPFKTTAGAPEDAPLPETNF
jgi:hypothetical protein